MFGLLKRKPAEPVGPFEFGHTIEIDRPAAEVYALIDWADPRNAKRALGNKVEQVASDPDRFRLHLDLVPGHQFDMIVSVAEPGKAYAFDNEITPPVGKMASSAEAYAIEPRAPNACTVNLAVECWFVGGLSDGDLAMEVMMMAMSCENALEKLKLQAEDGPEAVHRLEAQQMDCGFED